MTTTPTTSQDTAIGRVRGLVGDRDPKSLMFTDVEVQKYIDTAGSEYDAALAMVRAIVASLNRRVFVLQLAPSPDNVKIADAQAQAAGWRDIRDDLLKNQPTAKSAGLPVVRFGSLGKHPSDPWCP